VPKRCFKTKWYNLFCGYTFLLGYIFFLGILLIVCILDIFYRVECKTVVSVLWYKKVVRTVLQLTLNLSEL